MKFLGWMLLLAFTTASAQEVIESTPLSIQDDGSGGRQIVEGKKDGTLILPEENKEVTKIEPVEIKPESLEGLAPAQNPIDGQLKLETVPAANKPVALEIKTEEQVPEAKEKEVIAVAIYENPLKKYLQISFGYLNSQYEKIHPALDNGSMLTSFRFAGDINQKVQSGFAVEILNDTSSQKVPDNIRVIQYRLFVDYHSPLLASGLLDWVGGMSLSIGDYGVKRRYLNAAGEEVSVQIKNGTIVGLIPMVGVRFYLVGRSSFDLAVEFHQYFGNPQRHIGGLAFSPRFSFEF